MNKIYILMIHEKDPEEDIVNRPCRPIGAYTNKPKAQEVLDEVREVNLQIYSLNQTILKSIGREEANQTAEKYFSEYVEYYIEELELNNE